MEKDFIQICIKRWRWFAASVAFFLIAAILFLLMAVPRYERTASVMIKDQTNGSGLLSSMIGNMGMLAGFAGINVSSNVLNEIEILNSPATIDKVIDRLGLRTRYQAYDGL